MESSKLLLDEYPLLVSPSLAALVGLNESIILQQIHYWLQNEKAQEKDGYRWTYNSYPAWQKQFPFWSINTIQRIFLKLEAAKLLVSANFNSLQPDRTKWYRIDYTALNARMDENAPRLPQNGVTMTPTWGDDDPKLPPPIPETSPEIIKKDIHIPPHLQNNSIPHQQIIDHLNATTGQNYRYTTPKTQELIRARWNEGFRLPDFELVHRKKADDWANTEFQKFLRPATLYGPKFESYLNQLAAPVLDETDRSWKKTSEKIDREVEEYKRAQAEAAEKGREEINEY